MKYVWGQTFGNPIAVEITIGDDSKELALSVLQDSQTLQDRMLRCAADLTVNLSLSRLQA